MNIGHSNHDSTAIATIATDVVITQIFEETPHTFDFSADVNCLPLPEASFIIQLHIQVEFCVSCIFKQFLLQ